MNYIFFFKQKTAYEMRISDWSSDVCSSDLDSTYEISDELNCLKREAALITQYKRLHEGGPLTNLAGGVGNLSGSSPFSLARHAATLSGSTANNPERATLNRFLLSIAPVYSVPVRPIFQRSEEHTSELQSLMRISYAILFLKKRKQLLTPTNNTQHH